MFIAATHNGISRLYETFGNGGSADTHGAHSVGQRDVAHVVPAEPAAAARELVAAQQQQLRADGSARLAQLHRQQPAADPQNFYEKCKRSILKAKTEGPAAYVFTANDPRPGAQAELLRVLQKQRVEISRATAAFSVTMPVKVVAQGGRGGRGGRGGVAADAAASGTADAARSTPAADHAAETREFPAGSYIVRMDQPYSRIADALLDYQFWSPERSAEESVRRHGLDLPRRLRRAGRARDGREGARRADGAGEGRDQGAGRRDGNGQHVPHQRTTATTRSSRCATSSRTPTSRRPRSRSTRRHVVQARLVRHQGRVADATSTRAAKDVGVKVDAVARAPTVKTHPVRAARVAIMHTWQNTQTEGWWRQAFDFNGMPYDYISMQDVTKDPISTRSTT